MAFEDLLNEVMEALVGKVDGKLVERIGLGHEVLGSGKVEKVNKGDEIIMTGTFIDGFIKPSEQERGKKVSSQGCYNCWPCHLDRGRLQNSFLTSLVLYESAVSRVDGVMPRKSTTKAKTLS